MNPPETQSDSDPNQTYFDPEEVDSSEQFFSASLENSQETPSFVLDSSERLAGDSDSTDKQNPELEAPRSPEAFDTQDLEGRAPRPSELWGSRQEAGHEEAAVDQPSEPDWRDLVSAKVKHYKTVKPRKERYPSLQLQFDSRPAWKPETTVRTAVEAEVFAIQPTPPAPVLEDLPRSVAPVTTEATARVLEFPRPGMLPFNKDELAEPVVDRPRIIEAPELLPPPPALGGILIEPEQQAEPERLPGLDMPLTTAGLSRKIFATAVDGFFVGAALATFGYMFLRFNPSLPPLSLTAGIGAALLGILWYAYQFAFVNFCGTTLGLRAARLKIMRFDGTSVPRKLRRGRVLASVLSCVSLGLGYAWCFFDEDQLTWHDRITKTHLAPK